MRLRRRIIKWIAGLLRIFLLLVGGGGFILLGVYFPDIFVFVGIDYMYLRIIGFIIVIVTVVVVIAVFETIEHM